MSGFEAWWPAAEQRLREVLARSRTLTPEDVEDVVQRTAERALREEFRDEKHLTGWAVVVGRRICVDDWRRARLERNLDLQTSPATAGDVADEVVARIKRDGMVDAIAELTPFERDALTGEGRGDTRRAQVRQNVERHRIRKRLRAIYDTLGIVLGTWRVRGVLRFGPLVEAAGTAGAVGAIAVAAVASGATSRSIVPQVSPPPAVTAAAPVDTPVTSSVDSLLTPLIAAAKAVAAPVRVVVRPEDYWRYEPEDDFYIGGHTKDGQPVYGLGMRKGRPEDEGVLICSGYDIDPNKKCVYWPEAVQRVGNALDERGLGADDIFTLLVPESLPDINL